MSRVQKWLLTVLIVIGGGAGALAAVATSQVAVDTGAVATPALGWLFPLIIEGGAVVSVVLAWQRTAAGLSAAAEYSALLILLLLTVAVNATHADGSSWFGVLLAASPPVVLAGSVELLLRNMRTQRLPGCVSARPVGAERPSEHLSAPLAERPGDTSSAVPHKPAERLLSTPALSTERPAVVVSTERAPLSERSTSAQTSAQPVSTERAAAASTPRAPRVTTSAKPANAKPSAAEKQEHVAALLAENPEIKGPEVAARLGLGPSTARKYLKKAREAAAA
ncbi:DUF2637 domain-containing protein [Nocardioides eburneiflavus]|uniref:DUF2637 domain-containing protein n=1 Tax=Nocardioides eburneiflavus TaxID=2518372 RepID=A0A4Z1CA09_9ACTN|nr:DUF2637 domain-containing protein [Nocardioides eburneiflavus]TGN64216.1 DUF2637 domain-containing protein [Nocardioides eburneiflavus]